MIGGHLDYVSAITNRDNFIKISSYYLSGFCLYVCERAYAYVSWIPDVYHVITRLLLRIGLNGKFSSVH